MLDKTGQKLINIKHEDVCRAKSLSSNLGTLNNSITKGRGNVYGFLGELITANFLGVDLSNTYDYDIIYKDTKIDVKTKKVSSEPKPHYECSIANLNTKQKCDVYVFTRVLKDMSKGWILGFLTKEDYFNKATFLKRGNIDPSNNWTVKTDCFNLSISNLKPIEELI